MCRSRRVVRRGLGSGVDRYAVAFAAGFDPNGDVRTPVIVERQIRRPPLEQLVVIHSHCALACPRPANHLTRAVSNQDQNIERLVAEEGFEPPTQGL